MTEPLPPPPSFAQALRYWARLGLFNFGGPAGQIAMMQRDLVEERRWIGQPEFLQALNFCMFLPGPEATQLATYIGWSLHGTWGGAAAGTLFVLPGIAVLYVLSWLAAAHGDVPLVHAAFEGLKPVVVGIVVEALWRIGRRTLTTWPRAALAVAAFVAIQVLGIPFPAVVLGAAVIGGVFLARTDTQTTTVARPPLRRAIVLAGTYIALLGVAVALIVAVAGTKPFVDIARFFTEAAFVTFGGAYAVLPYVAHAAVEQFHWLGAGEMINGLALAETTPGPLILVLQYVGFFAGWNHPPAGVSPLAAATLGALLASYATFLPAIFLALIGAPYVGWLAAKPRLGGALQAITAAVVGVIATLGWFFGRTVFVSGGRIDGVASAIAVAAFVAGARFRIPMPALVLAGAAIGIARASLG